MNRRGPNILAAALAAGAMVAGMMPAQVAHQKETQPAAVSETRRRRRRRDAVEKKPTTWKQARELRLEELRKRARMGVITDAHLAELDSLEYEVRYAREIASRGRPARRMRRRRKTFAERLVKLGGVIGANRKGGVPLRLDPKTRAEKRRLMQALGVTPSGRQWNKLKRAMRRQERAA